MAANFNKVMLAGNLTRDPQLSYTPNNTAVCEFGMAINRRWKTQSGEMREDVCFVDIRAFARKAEVINQYIKKGNPFFVEGQLRYDTWEGKDGQKRSKLYVVIDNFMFMGSPQRSGGGGEGGYNNDRSQNNSGSSGGGYSNNDDSPPVREDFAPAGGDDIPF